jgi:hypothetical protein
MTEKVLGKKTQTESQKHYSDAESEARRELEETKRFCRALGVPSLDVNKKPYLDESLYLARATRSIRARAGRAAKAATFQKRREAWCWLTPEGLREFESNPFCRAFEVIRRTQTFGHRVCDRYFLPQRSWLQLNDSQRERFAFEYREILAETGLVTPPVFVTPTEIIFDCRLRPFQLIRNLEAELKAPSPIMVATVIDKQKGKPETVLMKSKLSWKPPRNLPVRYTSRKQQQWSPCRCPYMVRLSIPEGQITGDEIIASFTTFVQDKPHAKFASYRSRVRLDQSRKKSPRPLAPLTIVAGLMALDYLRHFTNLSALLKHLSEKEKQLLSTRKRKGGDKSLIKAFHKGKSSIRKVIKRLDNLMRPSEE